MLAVVWFPPPVPLSTVYGKLLCEKERMSCQQRRSVDRWRNDTRTQTEPARLSGPTSFKASFSRLTKTGPPHVYESSDRAGCEKKDNTRKH